MTLKVGSTHGALPHWSSLPQGLIALMLACCGAQYGTPPYSPCVINSTIPAENAFYSGILGNNCTITDYDAATLIASAKYPTAADSINRENHWRTTVLKTAGLRTSQTVYDPPAYVQVQTGFYIDNILSIDTKSKVIQLTLKVAQSVRLIMHMYC